MNKENKNLNLILRIAIIVTWVMSNISVFVLMTGLKNIETEGLDKDNVGERMLKIIGDFGSKTTLYYVTMAMLVACLVLAVITRYKTTLVSYIFKILGLVFSLVVMIGGCEYVGAIRACSGVSNLAVDGTSKSAVETALSNANVSDASKVAETLTNNDEAGAAIVGYMLPILILFILMITSIHCLVKKSDPNNKNGGSAEI